MATLLGIFSVIFAIINLASAQSPCRTPDNWNGNCVALKQCRPLYRLLTRSISTQQRNFLRQSKCGGDASSPLVCCPNTFKINDLPSNGKCGLEVPDRLLGGEYTNYNEFPWMALLHYRKPDGQAGFFCAGVLIHENYVLTAAQCIRGQTSVQNRYVLDSVRFGEYDLRTDPDCEYNECADPVVDIPIAETIVHENYVSTTTSQTNDIALIRLQHAAPFTDSIRPICLPINELQNRTHDQSKLMVVRFPRSENASQSLVKDKLQVDVFNLEQCSKIYHNASSINLSNKHLCAYGQAGKGTCNGDSGSPLVAEYFKMDEGTLLNYLVGILSLGPRHCGTPNFPDVHTRVDQYIDWILDHMKK